MNDNAPSLAVVIPAYREAEAIGRCLASLQVGGGAAAGPMEVVVVDNGSTDGTLDQARRFGVRTLENTEGRRRSISALRNLGARATSAPILLFLDADMELPSGWLETGLRRFREGFPGMLAFVCDVPPSAGWVGRVWGNRPLRRLSEAKDVDFLTGRNMWLPRTVFDAVGGFDERLTTGEDKDLTLRVRRAGYPALLAPDMTLTHWGFEHGLGEFIIKEFWRQSGALQLARKEGYALRTLRNPLLSAWHVLAACALALLLAFGAPLWAGVAAVAWGLPAAWLTARETGLGALRLALPLFLLTWLRWNAAGAALVVQGLRGGHART